jgi:hypothetical protein
MSGLLELNSNTTNKILLQNSRLILLDMRRLQREVMFNSGPTYMGVSAVARCNRLPLSLHDEALIIYMTAAAI